MNRYQTNSDGNGISDVAFADLIRLNRGGRRRLRVLHCLPAGQTRQAGAAPRTTRYLLRRFRAQRRNDRRRFLRCLPETGDAVYALTSTNLRMMTTIGDELGIDFQLRRPGSLDVATTDAQWRHLEEAVVAQKQAGLNVELLDAHEARKMQPALTPDILGAKFAAGHGHLWPFALVHGLAKSAANLGANIRTGTTVFNLITTREQSHRGRDLSGAVRSRTRRAGN